MSPGPRRRTDGESGQTRTPGKSRRTVSTRTPGKSRRTVSTRTWVIILTALAVWSLVCIWIMRDRRITAPEPAMSGPTAPDSATSGPITPDSATSGPITPGPTTSDSAMSGPFAGIYQDGVCVRRVDLSRIDAEERFVIESNAGYNVILIQPADPDESDGAPDHQPNHIGQIRVAEADCPDQICVAQGPLRENGLPIVCLPHGLVILMEDRNDA